MGGILTQEPVVERLLLQILYDSTNKMRDLIIQKIAQLYFYEDSDYLFEYKLDSSIKINEEFINFTDPLIYMKWPERRYFLINGGLEKFIQLLTQLSDRDLLNCYTGQCFQEFR